jgi:hypothetical protein
VLTVALNGGRTEWRSVQTVNLGLGPIHGLAAGDFNEDPDGHLDVVQTSVLAGTLSVFVGDGRGGFSKPTLFNAGTNPNFVVARDLDGQPVGQVGCEHAGIAVAAIGEL